MVDNSTPLVVTIFPGPGPEVISSTRVKGRVGRAYGSAPGTLLLVTTGGTNSFSVPDAGTFTTASST
jgi:hypothetical protein